MNNSTRMRGEATGRQPLNPVSVHVGGHWRILMHMLCIEPLDRCHDANGRGGIRTHGSVCSNIFLRSNEICCKTAHICAQRSTNAQRPQRYSRSSLLWRQIWWTS